MNQDAMQDSLVEGGGNGGSTSLGFATGTTCTTSGTYRCSNRYMDIVAIFVVGQIFLAGADGKKTTWFPLTKSLTTKDGDGGFRSVKVDAGTV
jgi:hypothetical protein